MMNMQAISMTMRNMKTTKTDILEKKLDIFFLNLPWWDNHLPYAAPGVLKGIVEHHGYSFKSYNSSLDLMNIFCKRNIDEYVNLMNYFVGYSDNGQDLINQFYLHIIDKIKKNPCKYLAISVFSVFTHKATIELLTLLRKTLPDLCIVVGGRGLLTLPHVAITDKISPTEKFMKFHEILKKRSLADRIILGDGEDAILDLLTSDNKEIIQIDANKKLDYPFSNFDDVVKEEYLGVYDRFQLPVVSSKGCVRSCDFCDVAAHMAKFLSKDGKRLAEEIIYLSKRYEVYEFAMSDSIVNGNMKQLKEACYVLAEYNSNMPEDNKVKWNGNWICRPPGAIKDDFFELLAKSGCIHLTIGAEHGSDNVLKAMDKKTNVAGLYYELEKLNKYNIQANLNTMIGHWSETYDDFLEHLDMMIKLGPYVASRTIQEIHITDFKILKNTPAADSYENTRIEIKDENFTDLWYTSKNPNNTAKTRIARLMSLYQIVKEINYPIDNFIFNLQSHNKNLLKNVDQFNKFFEDKVNKDFYKKCKSLDLIHNTNTYLNSKIKSFYKNSSLTLNVESFEFNGEPQLHIKHNGKIVFDKLLPPGLNDIELHLINDFTKLNNLEFSLVNKGKFDTEVDSLGKILSDKKIEIKSITIDGVDICKDFNFFYKHTKYIEEGVNQSLPMMGLYRNSTLILEYDAPFWRHILRLQPNHEEWRIVNDRSTYEKFVNNISKNLDLLTY